MKCAQRAAQNSKLKRQEYTDIPGGGTEIKGPTNMIEGDHQLRKSPQPPPTAWSGVLAGLLDIMYLTGNY